MLSTALLSQSDADAIWNILQEIDATIRAGMRRSGCTIPLDGARLNDVIAAEVHRELRRAGYVGQFQAVQSQTLVGQGVQKVQLVVCPSDESYDAADEILGAVHNARRAAGANGVADRA